MTRPPRLAALLTLGALALAGCGGGSDTADPAPSPPPVATTDASPESTAPSEGSGGLEGCSKDSLQTLEEGTLTVGTDSPAFPPWFADDDPTNGEGYESAVAYAVGEKLGYGEPDVTWTVAAFNAIVAPGKKPFDIALNQVSITDERRNAVDFSSGYYEAAQTVITVKGSNIADATSIADLKDAKLGAQVGTTSLDAITEVIEPSSAPAVFDSNDVAKTQLLNGQVDGIVVDLPTAFFITSAELDDGLIVGQLPATGSGGQDSFGIVLDKGSPLTECVTKAVDALKEDGTLDQLQEQYLAGAGAPELE